jgi:hypothetical protein
MRKALAVIVDFLAGRVGFAALLIVAAADDTLDGLLGARSQRRWVIPRGSKQARP